MIMKFENEHISEDEDIGEELSKSIKLLDKSQHIKPVSRNNRQNQDKRKPVSELVQLLGSTSEHAHIGQTLSKLYKKNSVLPKPLDKHEADKIKRTTGFEEIRVKLDRWNAIVARNRSTEHKRFPLLDAEDKKREPKDVYLSKFQIKSPLESCLDALQPVEEKPEESKFPLTMAEMIEHRKEAARIRAKQSYKEAKARRQNKIKSKKFHRIQRKEKIKEQLKEFETLQKTNPEEALKKLELLEKTRALERVTLRHKSTGQWAKNKLVRAKYDKETRQQLSQQLALSRELTQKIKVDDGAESDNENDNAQSVDELKYDASNPWIQTANAEVQMKNTESEYSDFVSGYKKYWENHNKLNAENNDKTNVDIKPSSKREINITDSINQTSSLKEDIKDETSMKRKRKNKTNEKAVNKRKHCILSTSDDWKVECTDSNLIQNKLNLSLDELFDEVETNHKNSVSLKLKNLQKKIDGSRNPNISKTKKKEKGDELSKLSFKKRNSMKDFDEELSESAGNSTVIKKTNNYVPINSEQSSNAISSLEKIDPNKFVASKPKYLESTLPNMDIEEDLMDDDEVNENKKITIAEAFEDDDIVVDFQDEKQKEIEKNKPKIDDSFLPGWGSWTGKNLSIHKRRKRRIFTNLPKDMPRKDDGKNNLIINEHPNEKLKSHLVSELPFPFSAVSDFEATIRAPLGNTFIPETAHKRVTKPSVLVKTGVVIKPMDESLLIDPKKHKKKPIEF